MLATGQAAPHIGDVRGGKPLYLRDLVHVIAVADCKNFTRAAEVVGISQPALSSKIKKLEASFGVDIFLRGQSEVTLTTFGAEMVETAREIVALSDVLVDRATTFRTVQSRPVRLGVTPTLAAYLSGYFREMFETLLPGQPVVIVEEHPKTLMRMVEAREVDLSLLARKSHATLSAGSSHPMDFTPLWLEPAYLAMRQDHPLIRTGGIRARDVPADQLIRFDTSFGYDLEADLPPANASTAERVGIDVRTARFETVCRHVAQSDACTLVNGIAAMQFLADDFGLAFLPFDDVGNMRELGAVSRPGCPRKDLLLAMRDRIKVAPPKGTVSPGKGLHGLTGLDRISA